VIDLASISSAISGLALLIRYPTLRGATVREAERFLRRAGGYSKRQAAALVHRHRERWRLR
jgi:hypothetical protein